MSEDSGDTPQTPSLRDLETAMWDIIGLQALFPKSRLEHSRYAADASRTHKSALAMSATF